MIARLVSALFLGASLSLVVHAQSAQSAVATPAVHYGANPATGAKSLNAMESAMKD